MEKSKGISFMRSLCMGQIEEDVLIPFPQLKDSEKEILKSIFGSVDAWLKGRDQDFRKWDRQGELPPEVLNEMKEMGLYSLIVPEEHGGLGLGAGAYSRMLQEVSKIRRIYCYHRGRT